jgi:hypothetical protein
MVRKRRMKDFSHFPKFDPLILSQTGCHDQPLCEKDPERLRSHF